MNAQENLRGPSLALRMTGLKARLENVAFVVIAKLPAEMCEGPIRLRHFMSVVAFLDRIALASRGVF
jgi:hypothetical protein